MDICPGAYRYCLRPEVSIALAGQIMICPCCSGLNYAECCKIYHDGKLPKSPLELMRSRYSAYALKIPEYIIETTHPNSPYFENNIQVWKEAILKFSDEVNFEKLEIISFGENWVHFKAYLGTTVLDEKSTFEKVDEKWLYLKGEFSK